MEWDRHLTPTLSPVEAERVPSLERRLTFTSRRLRRGGWRTRCPLAVRETTDCRWALRHGAVLFHIATRETGNAWERLGTPRSFLNWKRKRAGNVSGSFGFLRFPCFLRLPSGFLRHGKPVNSRHSAIFGWEAIFNRNELKDRRAGSEREVFGTRWNASLPCSAALWPDVPGSGSRLYPLMDTTDGVPAPICPDMDAYARICPHKHFFLRFRARRFHAGNVWNGKKVNLELHTRTS